MSASRICSKCSAPLVQDMSTNSGNLTCSECGCVAYENPIVSEVSFGETASGGAMVQGQMIAHNQARPSLGGRQNPMDSREQTLSNGRRSIKELASTLGIPDYIGEAGYGWFLLALNHNFVKGRRSQNVTAACLYIACRKEKTPHLLIDFSSKLQISVFTLGATFLKMVRALNIVEIPLADPSLFISHFADRLDFEREKDGAKNKIIKDALMIAKRMSDDWIHEGRRPAGIAGACVLLAARMNNFRRSHAEVVAVAHVSEGTIQNRMNEFGSTSSGEMSMNKFRENTTPVSSANPPSFLRKELKQKRLASMYEKKLKSIEDAKKRIEGSTQTTTPVGRLEGVRSRPGRLGLLRGSSQLSQVTTLSSQTPPQTTQVTPISSQETSQEAETETQVESETNNESEPQVPTQQQEKTAQLGPLYSEMSALGFKPDILSQELSNFEDIINKGYEQVLREKELSEKNKKNKDQFKDLENDPNAPKNLVERCQPTEYYLNLVLSAEDLDDVKFDEEDEDLYFNTKEEVQKKEILWINNYRDYLLDQERKRLKAEADVLAGNTSGRKKRRRDVKDVNVSGLGVEDALKATGDATAKEIKKLSTKINYLKFTDMDSFFQT